RDRSLSAGVGSEPSAATWSQVNCLSGVPPRKARKVSGKGITMSSSSAGLPTPEGPGSVSGAPNLPEGLTGTFTSRYVDAGNLRQHLVVGGDGPPLLLVHGWP